MFGNDNDHDDSSTEEENPYSFIGDNTREGAESGSDDQLPSYVRKWSLGNHSTANDQMGPSISRMMADLDDDVDDDLLGVLEEASGMVNATSINSFECPNCGLNHSHSDTKHDIRDAFNVDPDFGDEMRWTPYCHCGVNELAMLMDYFGHIGRTVFVGDEFEGIRKSDNRVLQNVLRHRDDIDVRPRTLADNPRDPQEDAMIEAIDRAGHLARASEVLVEQYTAFYNRVQEIKSAADNAPIPGHVRTDIEETREWFEANLD